MEFNSCKGKDFRLLQNVLTNSGDSPNVLFDGCTWGFFVHGWEKQLVHKADHSRPSRDEVKNEWSYISTAHPHFLPLPMNLKGFRHFYNKHAHPQ
jgi:hypothetical protein